MSHDRGSVDTSTLKKPIQPSVIGPEFMGRFQCLGEKCPDTCCNGWDIPVEEARYRDLREGLIEKGYPDPGPPRQARTGLAVPVRESGCVMQCDNGLCSVHAALGEAALPQVCADFPRLINRIDDRLELTGDTACPEVARMLLTEPGAVRIVELPEHLLTQKPSHGLITRGAPPYISVANEVRGFIISLLSLEGFTSTERLIAAHVFCAHTITTLHKECTEADLQSVVHTMQHLSNIARLRSLIDMVMREPVSGSLAFPVLSHVVRLGAATNPFFRPIAEKALDTYRALDVKGDDNTIWSSYELRRAMTRSRLGHYIDDAFWRMAYHDWVHSPYVLSPSLVAHAVSLQLPLAVTRWLLFAQPEVIQALDSEDDIRLRHIMKEKMVEVAYKTSRAVRHSNLLEVASDVFEKLGLDHAAASLLLARL